MKINFIKLLTLFLVVLSLLAGSALGGLKTGREYFEDGDYYAAWEELQRFIKRNRAKKGKQYYAALLILAKSSERLESYSEALDYYEEYNNNKKTASVEKKIKFLYQKLNKENEYSSKYAGSTSKYLKRKKKKEAALTKALKEQWDEHKKLLEANKGKPLSPKEIFKVSRPAVVIIRNLVNGQPASAGTGFIIKKNGVIITNNHVIKGPGKIMVTLSNEQAFKASIVRQSEWPDIAIIKIDQDNLPFLVLEQLLSPDDLVGSEVVAIGNPLNIGITITRGIISQVMVGDGVKFLQTDTPINPGNSGGPLIDKMGRVIGMNTLKMKDADGMGFAIASDHILKWIKNAN